MIRETSGLRAFIVGHPSFAERYDYIMPHVQRVLGDGAVSVGVVGADLSSEELAGHASDLSLGQIGCALSHVAAYEHMVKEGIEKAIVIEDDAILPDGFMGIAQEALEQLREGEIISFHSPTMESCEMSLTDSYTLAGSNVVAPMSARFVRSTLCYAIHLDAARRIAAHNAPVRFVADNFLAFYAEGWVNYLRICSPSLVHVAAFKSTIGYLDNRPLLKLLSGIVNALPIAKQYLGHRRQKLRQLRDGNHLLVERPSPLHNGNPNYQV